MNASVLGKVLVALLFCLLVSTLMFNSVSVDTVNMTCVEKRRHFPGWPDGMGSLSEQKYLLVVEHPAAGRLTINCNKQQYEAAHTQCAVSVKLWKINFLRWSGRISAATCSVGG